MKNLFRLRHTETHASIKTIYDLHRYFTAAQLISSARLTKIASTFHFYRHNTLVIYLFFIKHTIQRTNIKFSLRKKLMKLPPERTWIFSFNEYMFWSNCLENLKVLFVFLEANIEICLWSVPWRINVDNLEIPVAWINSGEDVNVFEGEGESVGEFNGFVEEVLIGVKKVDWLENEAVIVCLSFIVN